jgi:hypothetical protein
VASVLATNLAVNLATNLVSKLAVDPVAKSAALLSPLGRKELGCPPVEVDGATGARCPGFW